MAVIVLRLSKGSALTHSEVDANFQNLNNEVQAATSNITAAQGDIGALQSAVSVAESDIAALELDVTALENDVAGIEASRVGGFKNKIINGDFRIWQRGIGPSTTPGYLADRWTVSVNTGTPSQQQHQAIATVQAAVGGDFPFWLEMGGDILATVTAEQRIEGVATLSGKQATLSFAAFMSAGTADVTASLVQNFGSGGSSPVQTDFALTPTAANAGPQVFTGTVNVPSVVGKTIGTASYLALRIRRSLNTTGSLRLGRVQLEEGPAVTEFERRPVGIELILCQRYHYRPLDASRTMFKHTQGGSLGRSLIGPVHSFPVEMRVTPVLTYTDIAGNATRWTVGALDNRTPAAGGLVVTRQGIRADLDFGSIGQDYQTAQAINLAVDAEL